MDNKQMIKIQIKFKKLFELEVVEKLKEVKEINSKRNKLYSKIDLLYSKRDEFMRIEFRLELSKLYSKRDKLMIKRNKLLSNVINFLHNFGEENNCVVEWDDFNFKIKEIKLRFDNKNKKGFVFIGMEKL